MSFSKRLIAHLDRLRGLFSYFSRNSDPVASWKKHYEDMCEARAQARAAMVDMETMMTKAAVSSDDVGSFKQGIERAIELLPSEDDSVGRSELLVQLVFYLSWVVIRRLEDAQDVRVRVEKHCSAPVAARILRRGVDGGELS